MSEFLFLFRNSPITTEINPADAQKQMERWNSWSAKLSDEKRYAGGDRLKDKGTTLKSKSLHTDGPFAEGKEIIGGYMMIKAGSLEEATKIAGDCPIFLTGGTVEVREIEKM
jgi:hypothetical protein